ncbi:MAG: phosphotyrosine protein phosphatase, partial [Archangium gephyra]
ERVVLLLDWAGIEANGEVPDPYTGGPEDFQQVWRLVDSAARAVVDRLAVD